MVGRAVVALFRAAHPPGVRSGLLLILALAAACGQDDPPELPPPGDGGPGADAGLPSDAGADGGAPIDGAVDAGPDPSEPLFERSHLVRLEIEVAPADWTTLTNQSRTLETTLARPECLDTPFDSPFTYVPATVRLDGVAYAQVGIRKKGFLGSLSTTKPSLKIKLDEYQPGQEHLGLSTLTFNNGQQDPSQLRTCLAYDLFRRAGVPAPRCNYAEVIVNGVSLGPYFHVESVNKRFLRRNFVDDEGQLYEGTLSDFRDGWLGTFEQKTNETVPYDRSDLDAVAAALDAPNSDLLAALDPLLDLEAYTRFWAAEVLIDHWDGYSGNANNFYAYDDPLDRRFRFLPWGADAVLGVAVHQEPYSVLATSRLPRRLYQHQGARLAYEAELLRQLDESWQAPVTLEAIDQAAQLIAPIVPAAQRAQVNAATDALRVYVRDRAAQVRAELDLGGYAFVDPLRDRLCFDLGQVDAELQTRFGTHPTDNPFLTGTGVYTATVSGQAERGIQVGAAAGFGNGPDDQGQAVLLLAATVPGGSIPLVYVVLPPELLAPGFLPIDGGQVRAALLRLPPGGAALEIVGGFVGGYLEIRAGAATANAPIEVGVHGTLLIARP